MKGFLIMWEVIAASIAGLVSVILWFCNKEKERRHEEYLRKEERYSTLLDKLSGFYIGSQSKEKVNDFLEEYKLCWMYCPDKVINKIHDAISTVMISEIEYSDEDKEIAFGELVVAFRNDLFSRKLFKKPKLSAKDFRHLKANDLKT
jgi:Pyruvate/2-oxoacid:ferredoxin oxidoreductase delta subunit